MPGSTGTIREVDWQEYAETFPSRYVAPSPSDRIIAGELSRLPSGSGLDVGGGVRGTAYLWSWASECLLLDPCVRSRLPSVGWDGVGPRSFDAVVARGSLNYLSEAQIRAAALAVREGGLFAFNTFARPSEGSRRYSSKVGAGTERYRPVPGGRFGMIEHILEPDEGDPVVHWFLYYPVQFLRDLASSCGLKCEVLESGNTAVFLCRRR